MASQSGRAHYPCGRVQHHFPARQAFAISVRPFQWMVVFFEPELAGLFKYQADGLSSGQLTCLDDGAVCDDETFTGQDNIQM
ncbi:hypothetical protein NB703_001432 [Pantoea ananatis]|uniref:Uncharacterized protein n=1 Tax=Pantoea ananas TaxID=553 RepID=A0AAJ1CXC4_PANAN|nr:hypothetical protein [Pantoea ananatis]